MIYLSSFPLDLGMGPLIGAWITERLSWAWSFWIVFAFSCLGLQLLFLCGIETNTAYLQNSSRSSIRGFVRMCARVLGILRDPIVIMLTVERSVYFGVFYFMLSTFAGLLRERYHLTNSVSGVCYRAIGGGLWASRVAFRICSRWLNRDRNLKSLASNDYHAAPEYVLTMAIVGSLTLSAGLIVYGWTAEKHKTIAGPIIGQILFSFGYGMTPDIAARYLVDTYGPRALQIISGTSVLLGMCGFGFPLFARSFIRKYGYGFSSTILAAVTFTTGGTVYIILWLFARKFRTRSKYAPDPRKDLGPKLPAWSTARWRTDPGPEEGGAEED